MMEIRIHIYIFFIKSFLFGVIFFKGRKLNQTPGIILKCILISNYSKFCHIYFTWLIIIKLVKT